MKKLMNKITGPMLIVAMIMFYLGLFCLFCLLTTKICNIDPGETYTWYSGIWHGLFVIPNWALSWFYNDIYCKAPNATTAYNVWWWISFILFGLGILDSSRNK